MNNNQERALKTIEGYIYRIVILFAGRLLVMPTLHDVESRESAEHILSLLDPSRHKRVLFELNEEGCSALHTAAYHGRTDVIDYLCNLPSCTEDLIIALDNDGQTALHCAQNKEVAEILITKLTDAAKQNDYITTGDADGWTVLHLAVEGNNCDLATYLCSLSLVKDALLWGRDVLLRTAFFYAETLQMAQILLNAMNVEERVEYICARDIRNQTILHKASDENRTNIVAYICGMGLPESFITKMDELGRTALHYAGSEAIAQLLLETVASGRRKDFLLMSDDDLENDADMCTALHIAAEKSRMDVVKYLCTISLPDDELLLKRDAYGQTALHYAGTREIAEMLFNFVAGEKRKKYLTAYHKERKHTVLHKAADDGRTEVVEYLCSLPLPEEILLLKDEHERTALLYAQNKQIAECIVKAVNIEKQENFVSQVNSLHQTVLHVAALENRADVVSYVCSLNFGYEAGIQTAWGMNKLITVIDSTGKTALHEAKDVAIAEALIEGVKDKESYLLANVDNEGNTPLMAAATSPEVLEYLLDYISTFHNSRKILKHQLKLQNKQKQNVLHIIATSESIEAQFDVLEPYLDLIDIQTVIAEDCYNNTPLNYIASMFSTANFASFLMRLEMVSRRSVIKYRNRRKTNISEIIERQMFTKEFYQRSVLCGANTFYAVSMFYNSAYGLPQKIPRFDDNILKVVKYALNEYSLLDSSNIISHQLSATSMAIESTMPVTLGDATTIFKV